SRIQARLPILVFAALLAAPASSHATTGKSPHLTSPTQARHGSSETKAVSKHRKTKRHTQARTTASGKSRTKIAAGKKPAKHPPAAKREARAHGVPSATHPTR